MKFESFLKGIRWVLLFFGVYGMIAVQILGFKSLVNQLSEISEAGILDEMISWLIFIGTPLAYYYFLKEIFSHKSNTQSNG